MDDFPTDLTDAELEEATRKAMEDATCCVADEMVEQVECCLAEEAERTAIDDENAVRQAFARLYERSDEGELTWQQVKDKGDLLKARYAHTEYIQRRRCCTCGCPWNDED